MSQHAWGWRGQLCGVGSALPLCVGSGNRTQDARLVLYHGDISLCCDILCSSLLPLLCRVASLIILYFSFGYLIFQLFFMSLWLWLLFSSSWHRMPLSIVSNSSLVVMNSLFLLFLKSLFLKDSFAEYSIFCLTVLQNLVCVIPFPPGLQCYC